MQELPSNTENTVNALARACVEHTTYDIKTWKCTLVSGVF